MMASNSTDDSGIDVGTLFENLYIYVCFVGWRRRHRRENGPDMRQAMVQQPPSYSLFFGFGQSQVVLLISRKHYSTSNSEKTKLDYELVYASIWLLI